VLVHCPPNGLELSCPAEAGISSMTLGHAGGRDKHPRRPSPPGQLQRVVSPRPGAWTNGGNSGLLQLAERLSDCVSLCCCSRI
jgi:hypothetical protein